jgi:hypothetical protein
LTPFFHGQKPKSGSSGRCLPSFPGNSPTQASSEGPEADVELEKVPLPMPSAPSKNEWKKYIEDENDAPPERSFTFDIQTTINNHIQKNT